MHPGWYPDPFSDGMLRWWDGTTWTARTMPNGPEPWGFRLDPRNDLKEEVAAARWALLAVVGQALLSVASSLVTVLVTGSQLRHTFDHLGDPDYRPKFETAQFVFPQALGLVTLLVQIVFMFWLYRAATLAERARIPSRRSPAWAFIAWFVPVVNFWFPYQVAAGCFPPGHPLRRTAARWWAWNVAQWMTTIAIVVTVFFSEVTALVLCAAVVAIAAMIAREARTMISAITSVHTELVEQIG